MSRFILAGIARFKYHIYPVAASRVSKNGSERKTNFIKELLITTCAGLPEIFSGQINSHG